MKALIVLIALTFAAFSRADEPKFARDARIYCDGYVGTVTGRLVNNNINISWSTGSESRNFDARSCTDITPLSGGASVGTFTQGTDVACGGYFGKVKAILANQNIDIKWDTGSESVNFALSSCENISPVSNPSGGYRSGSEVYCDGYIGTVTDVLMNSNANIRWRSESVSKNFDLAACTNISVDEVQSREGYSVNADLSCDGYFGKLLKFRVNGSIDVRWDSSGSVTENYSLSSCTNVSLIEEDREISNADRYSQKDSLSTILNGGRSSSAQAF